MGIATLFRAAALIVANIFKACLAELFGHVNLMMFSVAAYFIVWSLLYNPESLVGVAIGIFRRNHVGYNLIDSCHLSS